MQQLHFANSHYWSGGDNRSKCVWMIFKHMNIFWKYAKTRLVGNIIKKCPTSISLLVFFGCICIYVPYLYLYGQRVGRCALESSSGASRKCTHAVSPLLASELAATCATCAISRIGILCEIFMQYTCKYAVICDLSIWRSCWRLDLTWISHSQ